MKQKVNHIVKKRSRSCGIIIPVFNEEKAITSTVKKIQAVASSVISWKFEIICVNDGSSDGTSKILRHIKGITLLEHGTNRGYGAALQTGLNFSPHDWVFIVDADATYPLEDFPRFLAAAEGDAAMVIGARRGIGISLSPLRRFARWILRKMAHVLTGVMVPDLNSGMRIFKKQLFLEFKNLLPYGFSFTTTLTLASLYNNYQIKFIPIDYAQRVGASNIRPVRDFFGFLMLIVRIATYFEPLRFFLPLSILTVAIGFAKGTRDFIFLGHIGALAVIVSILGIQFFVLGVLAEVIVHRSANFYPPGPSRRKLMS